ncbi:MAG: response regulator [Planctomycetaceae bacterium]|nr:response regulator [Planctomycetaceae bacterium]
MPTVLVVDDTRFSRGRIVAALKSLPVQIVEAADGLEALEQYAVCQPDVVISDLLMPRMTGLELVTELHARGSATPVIIVSADIQATSQAACRGQGVWAFVNKPFSAEELRATVIAALDSVCAPGPCVS